MSYEKKDMIRLFSVCLAVVGFLNAGVTQSSKSTANDPKAKVILDKLKKQMDSYRNMEIKFEFESEVPGTPVESQKGTMIQEGDKYQIKMKDQDIYCNGTTSWLYLKKGNEVQINDAGQDENEGFLSPRQVMNLYSSGKFIYALTEERKVASKTYADIEFKPVSKSYEYSKIRLTIDKTENKLVTLRLFSKDGTRFTLKLTDIISNKKYDPSIFSFNPKAVKGVHIEDLRMD